MLKRMLRPVVQHLVVAKFALLKAILAMDASVHAMLSRFKILYFRLENALCVVFTHRVNQICKKDHWGKNESCCF